MASVDDFLGDTPRWAMRRGQRRPLTPRQETALRIGIMAVWLIVCVVLLATGSVTGGIRAATQGLPGNATFGYCQTNDVCQGSFHADDVTDRQAYVVYSDGPHQIGDVVHGRLANRDVTTFYPDGDRIGPLLAPFVFVFLLVPLVVQTVLLIVRWRRGRIILRIDPPTR